MVTKRAGIGSISRSGIQTLRVHRTEQTLRSKVQETLRNSILDGFFGPGDKLVERELCDLTGVSRSILREALVHLETLGLIERHSYRGFAVASMTPEEIREIYEVRASLEVLAARLFTVRASDTHLKEISGATADLEAAFEDGQMSAIRQATTAFYDIILAGSGNREIRRALQGMLDRIFYLRTQSMSDPARRRASMQEMRAIAGALTSRNEVAGERATAAHVEAARDAVLARLERQGGATKGEEKLEHA
ncbi:GntR family transcriptional regulator [Nitratireductor sp. GCM10026969]|uniref:GntR family transcriptional regulator n=1 Tax=Nitratireductor sp. GCM10026969 TaxID=3252645 RepID=UPI00360EDD74